MATTSIPQYDPGSDEVWDAHYSLRTTIRRQEQRLKVQEDEIAALKATTANLTAAIGAILEYVNPDRGEWVYEEGQPPEYEEYAPSHRDYSRLLFQVPAEVLANGR